MGGLGDGPAGAGAGGQVVDVRERVESGRVGAKLPAVGQELIEAAVVPSCGELTEHIGQVGQWGDTVHGGGTHEAVEHGGSMGGGVGPGEEEVFSTEGYVADLAFAEVVVEAQATVFEEPGERAPLVEHRIS